MQNRPHWENLTRCWWKYLWSRNWGNFEQHGKHKAKKKQDTLVSGNAGDKKNLHLGFRKFIFLINSIELIKKINLRKPRWRFFLSPAFPETRVSCFFLALCFPCCSKLPQFLLHKYFHQHRVKFSQCGLFCIDVAYSDHLK